MAWMGLTNLTEGITKNVFKQVLHRYLGQYFEEKLTSDQLSLDFFKGNVTLQKISLDVQALNELSETQNWPLEFIDGYIDRLFISIPWTRILSESSQVEVTGLKITIQPKQRSDYGTSMFDSMWNSMTSSIKLAEEFTRQESKNANAEGQYVGVNSVAEMIDSALKKVKVKFLNTVIQLEHVPRDSMTGVGIIINIDLIDYFDEAGTDPNKVEVPEQDAESVKKGYVVQSFTTKNFNIEGVTVSTMEFPSKARTFSRSMMRNISTKYDEADLDTLTTDKSEEEFKQTVYSTFSDAAGNLNDSHNQRHLILFAKFIDNQEIKVHLRQAEEVSSPKVSIELNLGHLVLFLSPRQVHMLTELASGFASPHLEDHSNVPQRSACVHRPMTNSDFYRVEYELQQQMQQNPFVHTGGLMSMPGWSGAPLEGSYRDDHFLPMRNSDSDLYGSAMSGFSGSLESSLSSSAPSTVFTDHTSRTRRRSRGKNIDADPSAEVSHFQVQVSSIGLVLLHEDLLNIGSDGNTLVLSSVVQMQQKAKLFFDGLRDVVFLDSAQINFDRIFASFNNCCRSNHIRLLAAPIQLESKEKTTMRSFSITGSFEATQLKIMECLYEGNKANMEMIPLLKFDDSSPSKPSLTINFKHTARNGKFISKNSGPKTDININLGKCSAEFDITIVDRITALLNPPTVCIVENRSNRHNPWFGQTAVLEVQPQECFRDIKIYTPYINVKVRFPMPDFRPSHDLKRLPWWKKHVRPDHLIIICSEATLETSSHSSQTYSKYTFSCKSADIYYNETEEGKPLHIGHIGYEAPAQHVIKHLRMDIKIFPQIKQLDLEESDDDVIKSSFSFSASLYKKPDTGPFSSKRVIYHSMTPHDKQPQNVIKEEEMIVPGDKEEIEEFMRVATESARIHIDISLSSIKLQLVSKHIYELIYNRINNDLLLWEPNPTKHKPKNQYAYSNVMPETKDIFKPCNSGVQYDSGSETDDISEGDAETMFYSIYDRPKSAASEIPDKIVFEKQSNLVLSLQIFDGTLSFYTPVRDSTANVIPGQTGDFLLNVEDAVVFLVNGYKGDKGLGYVCVQVGCAALYHCDMRPTSTIEIRFPKDSKVEQHLHPTIHKSDKGVLVEIQKDSCIRDMLTVACKLETKHETHHVKSIKIALGLNQATLRHRMCQEPNTWISQILDFFNVNDYPIPGYNAKEVLTELHIHLWDCAIDYRPLYLPLRTVITLGSFSMTSHMSEKSNTSTLKFIAEECGLYISAKAPPKNGVPSTAPVDVRKDYINVISLGLFELSLRTANKNSKTHPHIDMRASNDFVHIYTCSDSGRALAELITYIATDGDLKQNENFLNSDSPYSSPRHHPTDQHLITLEPQAQLISKLTKSQHQHVNQLLREAAQEPEVEPQQEACCSNSDSATGPRLFFFPDENQIIPNNMIGQPNPQVLKELGDITIKSDYDSDDDFIIIDEATSVGLFPKNGEPEIKWLTNDPVRVSENHFSVPLGKKDLLKAPDDFPMPKYKYTLFDMNIVWHMYGGNDFKSASTSKKKEKEKVVSFSDTTFHDVSFSKKEQINFTQTESASRSPRNRKLSWKIKGGINRDHKVLMELELNKIKFQHEIYPKTAYHASRQVLLISDLEIRDLLASSDFNKFLYQYTSEARPKPAQGNMVGIKAIHIRPDKNLAEEECCLRLSLLPLRFNIDQDSLKFLVTFFSELGQASKESDILSSKQNTPTHRPVMTISGEEENKHKKIVEPAAVDDNLIVLDPFDLEEKPGSPENPPVIDNANQPVYFRNVVFAPEVLIKIDYQGKHVEVADGSLTSLLIGLVMGLGQLNCSELRLKRISYRHGLLGVDKLVNFLLQEWMKDIKKNQLPSVLSGVGPIYSLVQLFQGIKDLFWMPIEQYQRDGRIVRGIQRGANSFTTSTAMAALELTSRFFHLIQLTAETAYDMLSPGPSVRKICRSKGRKKRHNQPQDIREGVANALLLVREGFGETAGTIVQVASQEHEQKGYSGAVGGVLRQIPPTILKPVIIASEAASNVLGGMKYQLIPDARNEANQKWRPKDE